MGEGRFSPPDDEWHLARGSSSPTMAAASLAVATRGPRFLVRLLTLGAVLITGCSPAVDGGGLTDQLTALRAWTAGMGSEGPLVFGAAYLVLVVLFVPAWPMAIAAGAAFGAAVGFIVVSIASTLAAVVSFLLARHLLRDRLRGWLSQWPGCRRLEAAIGRDGVKVVALTRLSPLMPFNVLNLAFGLSPVDLGPYAIVSWVTMAPVTLLYVTTGATAVDLAASPGGGLGRATLALRLGGVVATAALVWWFARVCRAQLDPLDEPVVPTADESGSPPPGSS